MSLREYLEFLRSGRWWIGTGLALGVVAGTLSTLLAIPLYSASTTLYFVAVNGGGDPGQAYQGSILAEQKALAYSKLLTSQRVLDEVSEAVGGPVSGGVVDVQVVAGNPTLVVEASDPSPARAVLIADAVADKGAGLVADLERPKDRALTSVVEMRVVTPAVEPGSPTSPVLLDNLAVGLLLGVGAGALVTLVRQKLDQSVRTTTALEAASGRPSLGDLPDDAGVATDALVVDAPLPSPLGEGIRRLRTNLRLTVSRRPCTSLLVTSPVPREGKTIVAVNLALAFAFEGSRVLLIDADLRRPRVSELLGSTSSGLSAVLGGEIGVDEAIVPWRAGLVDVLPSGAVPTHPGDRLSPGRISALLDEVEPRYDVVVVDGPALLPVAEGLALAGRCDVTLLLVRHGTTSASEVSSAATALERASANVAGCAFTMSPRPSRAARSHGHYGPVPGPADTSPPDGVPAGDRGRTRSSSGVRIAPTPFARLRDSHADAAPKADAEHCAGASRPEPVLVSNGALLGRPPSPRPRVNLWKSTSFGHREQGSPRG